MPALAATRELQRSMVALRAVTYSDMTRVWALLDMAKLDASFPLFAAATLHLVQARRETATTLASAYLVKVRRQSGVDGQAPVVPAPPVPVDAVLVALRFSSVVSVKVAMTRGTDLGLASRNALVRTMGVVDKFVGDGAREWIRATIEADPAAQGWRRRTLGTCDFCQRLAGVLNGAGEAFPRHDHCGCQPEPVYGQAATTRYAAVKTVEAAAQLLKQRTGITLRPTGLSPEAAREFADVIDRLATKYPEIAADLGEVGTFEKWDGMDAFSRLGIAQGLARPAQYLKGEITQPGKIAVANRAISDVVANEARAATNARVAGHANEVVIHEFGHHLGFSAKTQLYSEWRAAGMPGKLRGGMSADVGDNLLEDLLLGIMREQGAALRAGTGFTPKVREFLNEHLSTYGATNVHEAIAECFAEVEVKGPAARPFARRVVEELRRVAQRTEGRGLKP